jgi:GAF domain-containing protein
VATQERLAEVFVELADTLVDDFDVVDFLSTLAQVSVELVGVEAAGLMLSDMRGDLQVVASSNEKAHLLELFELQQDQGPCVECFRTGQPLTNVVLPDDRWPSVSAAALDAGLRSCHAIPLRLRENVIGALNLFGADVRRLSETDVALARALGDIATIGLLQERAIRDHVVLVEQLQSALNSRVLIEQAKGALGERTGLDMDKAFNAIRSHARHHGQSLNAVATAVVNGTLDITAVRTT